MRNGGKRLFMFVKWVGLKAKQVIQQDVDKMTGKIGVGPVPQIKVTLVEVPNNYLIILIMVLFQR